MARNFFGFLAKNKPVQRFRKTNNILGANLLTSTGKLSHILGNLPVDTGGVTNLLLPRVINVHVLLGVCLYRADSSVLASPGITDTKLCPPHS